LDILTVLGGLFIPQPWLALLPGLVFAGVYWLSGRHLVRVAALAWLLYAPYEYAMHRRWLCSGECNIRVDLLLVYPALILISLAAVVLAINTIRRRGNHS
jgi:hypothetical protein